VNLILAEPGEIDSAGCLRLTGRRHQHLRTVLRSVPGDRLRVGELGGRLGEGTVLSLDADVAVLEVRLDRPPPAPLALRVILALPRPKMLRRILQAVAELGVKELYLINSYRVEKSFWQSPLMNAPRLEAVLREGLEQAGDTILPRIELRPRFRPFVEDELPGLCLGHDALLADPAASAPYPAEPARPSLLAIGPEGGFIPFERDLLIGAGMRPVRSGTRVLRVETALQACVGRHLEAGHGGDRAD
jgi:RsmE family RNA methyltransferase